MKTLAAVLEKINNPLRIEELTVPKLKHGQALVKIAYSGICHSQLNEIKGLKGDDRFLPHTLGHEGSGIVEMIGIGVDKVKPGDCVVLTWIKGRGMDAASTLYKRSSGSVVNSGPISTFLTHAVISENRLVKIPSNISLRDAAMLGCAIPTGVGIIRNSAHVQPGNSVAIFGVGGIGLSAVFAAHFAGANPIIAIDIYDQKLSRALSMGATHLINASQNDPLEEILKITDGYGVNYAIESVGHRQVMETAFKSVRDKGGLCVLAGNLPAGETIALNPFDLIKGKRIIGTWGGETDPDKDIQEYAQLFISGELKIENFGDSYFQLKEINKAFDMLDKGDLGRGIIEF